MSRPTPEVKKRYNDKTIRITFSLNLSESEQVKNSMTQTEANKKAKELFLESISNKKGC